MVPGSSHIRIIITVGTFDKAYDSVRGELTLRETHLPQILENVGCVVPVTLEINRLVDSLDMGEDDRKSVRDSCYRSSEDRIVVTHGTDTMADTARVIADANASKTVVLTGAMVPYAVHGSDALFNLGAAIVAAQILDPGVYICMHGRVFGAESVRKNRELGLFEEVEREL